MSKVNIDELLFRCHSLGDIMGVKGLGKTGMKRAMYTYMEAKTGRTKQFSSKYTDKGITNESEAIDIISEHLDVRLVKNELRLSNEYITGECDTLSDDTVYDLKNSWDVYTFADACMELNSDHEWQLRGYMDLYGKNHAKLCYVLTNAPDALVFKELERESYKHPDYETPEWIEVDIIKSMIFTKDEFMKFVNNRGLGGDEITDRMIETFIEIPIQDRIKIYDIERDQDAIDLIYKRVEMARNYLHLQFD
jgi:hypothetical protein